MSSTRKGRGHGVRRYDNNRTIGRVRDRRTNRVPGVFRADDGAYHAGDSEKGRGPAVAPLPLQQASVAAGCRRTADASIAAQQRLLCFPTGLLDGKWANHLINTHLDGVFRAPPRRTLVVNPNTAHVLAGVAQRWARTTTAFALKDTHREGQFVWGDYQHFDVTDDNVVRLPIDRSTLEKVGHVHAYELATILQCVYMEMIKNAPKGDYSILVPIPVGAVLPGFSAIVGLREGFSIPPFDMADTLPALQFIDIARNILCHRMGKNGTSPRSPLFYAPAGRKHVILEKCTVSMDVSEFIDQLRLVAHHHASEAPLVTCEFIGDMMRSSATPTGDCSSDRPRLVFDTEDEAKKYRFVPVPPERPQDKPTPAYCRDKSDLSASQAYHAGVRAPKVVQEDPDRHTAKAGVNKCDACLNTDVIPRKGWRKAPTATTTIEPEKPEDDSTGAIVATGPAAEIWPRVVTAKDLASAVPVPVNDELDISAKEVADLLRDEDDDEHVSSKDPELLNPFLGGRRWENIPEEERPVLNPAKDDDVITRSFSQFFPFGKIMGQHKYERYMPINESSLQGSGLGPLLRMNLTEFVDLQLPWGHVRGGSEIHSVDRLLASDLEDDKSCPVLPVISVQTARDMIVSSGAPPWAKALAHVLPMNEWGADYVATFIPAAGNETGQSFFFGHLRARTAFGANKHWGSRFRYTDFLESWLTGDVDENYDKLRATPIKDQTVHIPDPSNGPAVCCPDKKFDASWRLIQHLAKHNKFHVSFNAQSSTGSQSTMDNRSVIYFNGDYSALDRARLEFVSHFIFAGVLDVCALINSFGPDLFERPDLKTVVIGDHASHGPPSSNNSGQHRNHKTQNGKSRADSAENWRRG